MTDSANRPTPRPNVDWRSLPIGPTEAFVLSQVDGRSDVEQLCTLTGLPHAEVGTILSRLAALGALDYGNAARSPTPVAQPSNPVILEASPKSQAITRHFDLSLLDAAADLDLETKRLILELEAASQRETHYELLGVAPDAEKKLIKTAYYELIHRFHTDRHYGKDLGIFRTKLEKVSSALTKAHDTLTRNKSRTDYDKYLESRVKTRGLRDSLPPSGAPSAPPPPVLSPEPDMPPAPLVPNFDRAISGASETAPPRTTPSKSPDPGAQKRLLARKLGLRPPTSSDSEPVPATPDLDVSQVRDQVARDLKARFDARKNTDERARGQHYVELGRAALEQKNWGSAVNALRIARGILPNDKDVQALFERTAAIAERELAGHFAEQAKYEQRDGHFDRAARSYERAARGKEGSGENAEASRLYHEAATCAIRDGMDPKKIAELARKAVSTNGRNAEYRVSLARAYETIGMRSSALGELSRALELDPDNALAKALQKQLR